jgi:hypothetical protein
MLDQDFALSYSIAGEVFDSWLFGPLLESNSCLRAKKLLDIQCLPVCYGARRGNCFASGPRCFGTCVSRAAMRSPPCQDDSTRQTAVRAPRARRSSRSALRMCARRPGCGALKTNAGNNASWRRGVLYG